jgi:hypothetical protein
MARSLARHAASMRVAALHRYQSQACTMTLAEGIAEYPAAHVVFGCGTPLDDEAAVKVASRFGTTRALVR